MIVQDILNWVDSVAPFNTAEGFDNVGLLIGDERAEVSGIMFGLDITEALIEETIQNNANLIITHHPFLFHAVKQIRYDSRLAHCLKLILNHQLHVIAAHTNWDKAEGGISDTLAAKLGLQAVEKTDPFLRVGTLPEPMSFQAFGDYVEKKLQVQVHLYGQEKTIRTVGVAGGGYGEAAGFCGADALVTGEIRHSDLLEGTDRGLALVCAQHYATEYPGLVALKEKFVREYHPKGLPVFLHELPPFPGAQKQ